MYTTTNDLTGDPTVPTPPYGHPANARLKAPLNLTPWDLSKTLFVPDRLIVGPLIDMQVALADLVRDLQNICGAGQYSGDESDMQRAYDDFLDMISPKPGPVAQNRMSLSLKDERTTTIRYAPDEEACGPLKICSPSLIDNIAASRHQYLALPPVQALRREDSTRKATRAKLMHDTGSAPSRASVSSRLEGATKPDIAFVVTRTAGVPSLRLAKIRGIEELKMLAESLGRDMSSLPAGEREAMERIRKSKWEEGSRYKIQEVNFQAIFGLRVTYLLCGNTFALAVFNTSYTRIYHLEDDTIAVECPTSTKDDPAHQAEPADHIDLADLVNETVDMVHDLAFPSSGGSAADSTARARFLMTHATILYHSLQSGRQRDDILRRDLESNYTMSRTMLSHDDAGSIYLAKQDAEKRGENAKRSYRSSHDRKVRAAGMRSPRAGEALVPAAAAQTQKLEPAEEEEDKSVEVGRSAVAKDSDVRLQDVMEAGGESETRHQLPDERHENDEFSEDDEETEEERIVDGFAWWTDVETVRALGIRIRRVSAADMDLLVAFGSGALLGREWTRARTPSSTSSQGEPDDSLVTPVAPGPEAVSPDEIQVPLGSRSASPKNP